jgi:tRNA A-37 threonylcarbamoyl transferase component Bud32
MDSPPLGDRGSGPLNRPANTDATDTLMIPPTPTQTFVQAGILLKDRYLIVRELSSGGFGKVFLAQDQQLHNRPVVVKIQLDRAIEDPWFEKKFNEELRALALIDHPGVVGALDSARTPDGRPFLVMQYVEGHPLRSVICAEGLPLDRAANIIRQIGQALGAAHNKNIWHRDLKPENIMLQLLPGGDEHVRLIDFGLATIADLAAKQQTHTRIAGSVGYMAPEQFSGQPSASTDIYAFGVIAYEIVTGRKPFVAEDVIQLSVLQRSGVKLKPSALRPGISSQSEKLILHSLNYNPGERPASASAFGEALSQALLNSYSNPTIQMAATVHTRRVRLGWLAGALVAAVLASGAAWIYRGRIFPATQESARPANAQLAPGPAAVPAPIPKSAVDTSDEAVELAFWNSIGSSTDPRLYREYLAKYPGGKFATLAKLKLEEQPVKPVDAHQTPPSASSQPATAPAPSAGVPAIRPMLKPDEYGGPLRGELQWAGSLQPGASLTIQGGKAIAGDLTGDLPRVPSTVESLTTGVSVAEQPSAANQWDRVVVKNASSTPLASIQIRWRVAR